MPSPSLTPPTGIAKMGESGKKFVIVNSPPNNPAHASSPSSLCRTGKLPLRMARWPSLSCTMHNEAQSTTTWQSLTLPSRPPRSSREGHPETNPSRCLTTSPRRSLARPPRSTRSVRSPNPHPERPPRLTTDHRHHPDLAQGAGPREGLPGAHRARQEQGPPRQGPRPPAHQDPQDHGTSALYTLQLDRD